VWISVEIPDYQGFCKGDVGKLFFKNTTSASLLRMPRTDREDSGEVVTAKMFQQQPPPIISLSLAETA